MKKYFKASYLLLAFAFGLLVISVMPAGIGMFSKAFLVGQDAAQEGTFSEEETEYHENYETTGDYEYQDDYSEQGETMYQPMPPSNYGSGEQGEQSTYDNQGPGNGQPMDMGKECGFMKRDAHRMQNEIRHLIKNKTREKADTSELDSLLAEVEGIETKLESCSSLTGEDLQQLRLTLMGEMGDGGINAKLFTYRCESDKDREEKDYERMKKDSERTKQDLKSMSVSGEMGAKVKEHIARIDKILELKKQIIEAMSSCTMETQYELEDLRWEMRELEEEMMGFWEDFEETRNNAWAGQMFDQIEKDIAEFKASEYDTMPPFMQEKFNTLSKVALELISKGRACMSEDDMDCVREVQMRLEELGRKADEIFGRPEVDFEEMGFDEDLNHKFEKISEDRGYGEATQIIQYLLSLDPTLAEKITDPAMADKIFRIMGKMPENVRAEYLEKQGELKETLDEAIVTDAQLKNYQNEILGANFLGDALDEAIDTLEEVRDGKVSAKEFAQKIEEFKAESKGQEVELGVSKFKDATSDTWYYDAAHYEDFNIQGKNMNGEKVFDPAGQSTFAETLKVLAEALGLEQTTGTSFGPAQKHWSAGYYGAVEGKGVTFLNPDHKITRGQMARLIVELTGLPIQHVETPFTDLSGNEYESYVATLYANGVMNGNPDHTVKPNNEINRAEAFTLVKNMIENLGLMVLDTEEIEEIGSF